MQHAPGTTARHPRPGTRGPAQPHTRARTQHNRMQHAPAPAGPTTGPHRPTTCPTDRAESHHPCSPLPSLFPLPRSLRRPI